MTIDIAQGDQAYSMLSNDAFLREWALLCEKCPWTTPSQGIGFVTTWYRVYRERFCPVILSEFSPEGEMVGLLTLAVSSDSLKLVVAGDLDAEYEVWLSDPDNGDAFIEKVMEKIRETFPTHSLVFEYLPPLTPVGWTASDRPWGGRCQLTCHDRPLLEAENAAEFLSRMRRKKEFRLKLNRLKKLGDVQCQWVTDPDEFAPIMDKIAVYHDFRHGAVHGRLRYEEDLLKNAFNLALIAVPDLFRLFVLKAGSKIIATRGVLCGKNSVHLFGHAQSPFYDRLSPGMLSLLLMSESLMKEGCPLLDLTPSPGRVTYKERFATTRDEVRILRVFPSRRALIRHKTMLRLESLARRVFSMIHIRTGAIKEFLQKMRGINIADAVCRRLAWPVRWLFRNIWHRCELQIYSYKAEDVIIDEQPHLMSKDSLSDLLAHLRNRPWHRKMFLSASLTHLRDGDHVYTYAEHGRLLHYGWVTEHQKEAFQPKVHQAAKFPPGSAVLGYFYTVPDARGRGLYQSSLRQILQDLAAIPGIHKIYILVLANNAPSRHTIEKVGFTYEYSLFERKILGKGKRWSSMKTVEPQRECSEGSVE